MCTVKYLGSEISCIPGCEVKREKYGVKIELIHQFHGGFNGMGSKSDEPDFSLFAGCQESLHSPIRAKYGVYIFRICYSMQLIQIEMIRTQVAQGLFKFLSGSFLFPFRGLAGQENILPVGFQVPGQA